MQGAARIIAMGGYNTVCEVLSLGRPALIAPRTVPRAEQVLRAERLAARGLIDMIRPEDVTPDALATWLAGKPAQADAMAPLDINGLVRVRALAEQLLSETHALCIAS
jgi:predicted glycosyltransferase